MQLKYLIFDFDGVLGDTNAARKPVLQKIAETKHRNKVPGDDDQYFIRSTHTRDMNLPPEKLAQMREWTIEYGKLLMEHSFELFHEFIHEVGRIPHAKLAVVSSGSAVYIQPKLSETHLTFSHILTFEDHHSKEEKVEWICRDWNVSVKDVYFFTDTLSDIAELEHLIDRNKLYGCAWGYQGADMLSTALDDAHILKNFSDIHRIFG
jgi:FMN phosphatase YigB (HAD superfamily)